MLMFHIPLNFNYSNHSIGTNNQLHVGLHKIFSAQNFVDCVAALLTQLYKRQHPIFVCANIKL